MDIKFTPWRMNYLKSTEIPAGVCVLCHLHQSQQTDDEGNLLLYRGETCYVVMNLYPYNTGHVMVVPYEHTANLATLPNATSDELFLLTRHCVAHLTTEYHPHGFNIGMNVGRVAGAGIDEHLHMHVVPRWGGDMNFLPLFGNLKLVPEELPVTYARLRPYFEQ